MCLCTNQTSHLWLSVPLVKYHFTFRYFSSSYSPLFHPLHLCILFLPFLVLFVCNFGHMLIVKSGFQLVPYHRHQKAIVLRCCDGLASLNLSWTKHMNNGLVRLQLLWQTQVDPWCTDNRHCDLYCNNVATILCFLFFSFVVFCCFLCCVSFKKVRMNEWVKG